MKRVLTPSLFITYPPSPFLSKRSFSVLFTFPNIGQNKSRWRLMLTATLLHIKNSKVSSPSYSWFRDDVQMIGTLPECYSCFSLKTSIIFKMHMFIQNYHWDV